MFRGGLVLTAFVNVDPSPTATAGTYIFPGSHRWGTLPGQVTRPPHPTPERITTQPGHVAVLFDSAAFHFGPASAHAVPKLSWVFCHAAVAHNASALAALKIHLPLASPPVLVTDLIAEYDAADAAAWGTPASQHRWSTASTATDPSLLPPGPLLSDSSL